MASPVSGEPTVVLIGEHMRSLVAAASRFAEAGLERYAIIGGVAVNARLGRGHRATADLDTVVDDDIVPTALEVLTNLDGTVIDPAADHRFYIEGTKLEIIGTHSVTDDDLAGLDDLQTLFIAGHRWALDTATPLRLMADDGSSTATVLVARAGALIATKLHAIQDRRARAGIDKRSGDAWDIYRLLTDLDPDGAVAAELSNAPRQLRRTVQNAAQRILVESPGRTRGWLSSGDDRMGSVTVEELVHVGETFIAHLERTAEMP